MMTTLGTLLVWEAMAATLASIGLYIAALRRTAEGDALGARLASYARTAFFLAAAGVIGTAVVHSTLLMTHHFEVNYVYRYSARELPPFYLFATFWAGQEGSFLLWAFWTAVLGVFLAVKSGAVMERRVMPIYGGVLAFLVLLLIVKSPFAPYAPVNFTDPTGIPKDGIGLNPLLENPWMVIHPPTLFFGFASLAATFAFAVAGLVWGDFDHWYRRTWPWALLSFSVLGFGIMLGGYWAYDTLGWGGFWGWDPVENGPLVPWLGMTAFLHAAQVQRTIGGLKKTTFFLGLFPFVAALYETFLTRTGILDKFSNHSFSTLGGVANSVILYGLLIGIAGALGLLFFKTRNVKNEANAWDDASSKEFGYTLAIVLLMVCAVITGAGMSAPLITQAGVTLGLVKHQSSVGTDFYNKANFPIAVLLSVGMGVGPFLAWRKSRAADLAKLQWTYMGSVLCATAFYALSWFWGHYRVSAPQLLLFAAALFAALASGQLLITRFRHAPGAAGERVRTLGGHLAHIGGALLLLGIVCLVTYTRSDEPVLWQGHSTALDHLPYSVTYVGMTSNLKDPANLLKFRVDPTHGGAPFIATMPLAVRNVEGQMKLLARPAVLPRWWGDLYFALKDGPEDISITPLRRFTLTRGDAQTLTMPTGRVLPDGTVESQTYKIAFQQFHVPDDLAALARQGIMPKVFPVTAELTVTDPTGKTYQIAPKFIQNRDDPTAQTSPEVALPHTASGIPWKIAFESMVANPADPSAESAKFYLRDGSQAPVTSYQIEVSTRPMINLVWLGTVLITLGGFLSMRRRALENRLSPVPDPDPTPSPDAATRQPIPRERRAPSPSRKPAPAAIKGGR